MTRNKKTILALMGVVLFTALWLGASVAGSHLAESKLRTFAAHPDSQSGVRIVDLRHERGLLSSNGRFDLQFHDACQSTGAGDLTVQVEYHLDHLILPTSLLRFEWRLAFAGDNSQRAARLFGIATRLEGKGHLSLGGTASSNLALPELSVRNAGVLTQISPITGHVAIGRNSLALDWKSERIVARGNGKAFELRAIDFSLDLRNRTRGVGTFSFAIDGVATSEVSAEGFRFLVEAGERADRIDVKVSPTLRSMQLGGKTARDLALEIALKDIHTTSVETINRIAGETCMMKNMTVEEDRLVRQAVRTLLLNGLSVGISKIAGTIDSGRLDGEIMLTLDQVKDGDALDLARRFKASGRLAVKGKALSDDQKSMMTSLGLATESPDGLTASFDYANGLLKANGRAFDAGEVQRMLSSTERALNQLLATDARPGEMIPSVITEFRVWNRSPDDIVEIRLSAVNDPNWGADLLGDDILSPGNSFTVPSAATRGCTSDIRVVFASGTRDERRAIDLCTVRELSFGGSP